jgi:hypothetical protein
MVQRPMCAKGNGANLSPTLLVEEWDGQYKYGGCLHPSKLCDAVRRKTAHGGGRGAWARGTCVNGPPKSAPFAGVRLPFAVFIFGDSGPKSVRYENLNPKPNRFRSLTRREVALLETPR